MSSPVEEFRDRYNASTSTGERVVIVRQIQDAVRAWRWTPRTGRTDWRPPPPGRPASRSSGRVLARASAASGLSVDELRATVGNTRTPTHPAVVAAALEEVSIGTTFAAVARELGLCERTVRRWK